MSPLTSIIFIAWCAVASQQHLAADTVTTYLIPTLDTETLFKTAMAINSQWSISAAHALSLRIEFLSMNQMGLITRRIRHIMSFHNTSTEASMVLLFADCIQSRKLCVIRFRQNPEINPIRIRMNSTANNPQHYILKIRQNVLQCRTYRIVIDVRIMERNGEYFHIMTRSKVIANIGSHPLFELDRSRIVLFPSFIANNKMHYHKREVFEFSLKPNEKIYAYDIRIYSQRKFMQRVRGITAFDLEHVNHVSPAHLTDVFAVKLSLLNGSNSCFRLNPFTKQIPSIVISRANNHAFKRSPQLMCSESMCRLCTMQ